MTYVELFATSNFTFLTGASHAEELVTRARKVGLGGLAIADKNTFAGIVRGHSAARDLGLRYLVATRLVLTDGTQLLAYPRHRQAFGQLCRLLTLGKRRTVKGSCELSLEDVLAYGAECILIGLDGPDFETTLKRLGKRPLMIMSLSALCRTMMARMRPASPKPRASRTRSGWRRSRLAMSSCIRLRG